MKLDLPHRISNEWPAGLVPANVSRNPRSTSGILFDERNANGPTLHYKRLDSQEFVKREGDELQRALIATSAVNHVMPIRLHTVAIEQRLLITEHIDDAKSLFNYVWNGLRWWKRNGFRRCSPAELGKRLATWLNAYHASTVSERESPALLLRIVIDQTRGKLNAIERHSNYISQMIRQKIRCYLDSIENAAADWRPELTSRIHGDFGLANMLVNSKGTLFVLDFADTRLGLPWEDLVRVWHEIWTFSQLSSHRSRILQPCLNALIHDYGLSDTIHRDPLFMLLRCWNAVCNILTVVFFSRKIGFTAGIASRRLARVNACWLESIDWPNLTERCFAECLHQR